MALRVQRQIGSFSVPLLFVGRRGSAEAAVVGGSALLWESTEGRFVVTAAHVWNELVRLRRRAGGEGPIFIADETGLLPLNRLAPVDLDDGSDLAVLASPELRALSLSGMAFCPTAVWPIDPVATGEVLAACGYPAGLRYEGRAGIQLGSTFVQHPGVVSANGWMIWMNPEGRRAGTGHAVPRRPRLPHLGGISGAPVFACRRGGPEWVGIVRSGRGTDPADCALLVSPSVLIRADGHLIRPSAGVDYGRQ